MDLDYLASFGDQVPLSQFKPDDTISVLAFSSDGRFLASGDHAGRVVIFQINPPKTPDGNYSASFVCQIHAHKAEFDYFRSELSEMKINSLKWVPTQTLNPLLLSCNSHDAKLWRLNSSPKIQWKPRSGDTIDTFVLPTAVRIDQKYTYECVKTYTDLQTEYLVDLQCLPDQHSFLMIDVSCVKLWDIERDVASVSLYRVSQSEPEITTSAAHASYSFAFLIGDDAGTCRILDMRQQTEDLTPSIETRTAQYLINNNAEGIEGVSSVQFSSDGSSFVVRTFGDLQMWDLRNTSKPVNRTEVHWFPQQMDFLSNEDYVKDQFRTTITRSGKVVTGQYMANFISWDPSNNQKNHHKAVSPRVQKPPAEPGRDFSKRVTCCEAHPQENIVACVSTAALYLFQEKEK
ncbi:hypothetical protein TRFO_09627 [Tritrichomonas foetus]|uniref:Serine/threonine-protein phosphatase 2A 55 kDa regulatory subunit B n=1 Tax=Tritrichomonas foetus TaxID=1144522 RepID=A0A1J4JFL7_9EUKA|nr:hypothetical protein TRFO_09627 [Tritrichomonas foetus]|eukprot:OHS97079.1 hypothetical protein TRFO_09627 [Tritrichomonas foetus]